MEATLRTDLQDVEELRSMSQVYVIYVEASSSCSTEHFWHPYPIRIKTTEVCVTFYSSMKVAITFKLPRIFHWYVL